MCGKTVGHKNRKALFSVAGLRERIAERLSHLSELTVTKDNLSEFACYRCVNNLDKYARLQLVELQSEKLKTDLNTITVANDSHMKNNFRKGHNSLSHADYDVTEVDGFDPPTFPGSPRPSRESLGTRL